VRRSRVFHLFPFLFQLSNFDGLDFVVPNWFSDIVNFVLPDWFCDTLDFVVPNWSRFLILFLEFV
jgi:hypothetical protein